MRSRTVSAALMFSRSHALRDTSRCRLRGGRIYLRQNLAATPALVIHVVVPVDSVLRVTPSRPDIIISHWELAIS